MLQKVEANIQGKTILPGLKKLKALENGMQNPVPDTIYALERDVINEAIREARSAELALRKAELNKK